MKRLGKKNELVFPYIWDTLVIGGIPTKYEVSTKGEVRNTKTGRILKQTLSKFGYLTLQLSDKHFNAKNHRKKFFVHRLVAFVFIHNPDPEHKIQVNHIDHNRTNNFVNNLEWVSPLENQEDCSQFGTQANRILTEEQVEEICKRLENGERPKDICKDYGVKEMAIKKIAKGITWRFISENYNIHPKNYKFKITEEQAEEICRRLSRGEKARKIAEIVGTTEGNIRNIIKGRNWKWISKKYKFPPSGRAKPLKPGQVHKICAMLETQEYTNQEIADNVGTTTPVINMIKGRRNWTEISKFYKF